MINNNNNQLIILIHNNNSNNSKQLKSLRNKKVNKENKRKRLNSIRVQIKFRIKRIILEVNNGIFPALFDKK